MSSVLEVDNLEVAFPVSGGIVKAVDGVSLQVAERETLAVVGESGCGKTTLARAILGLQKTVGGTISINGRPVRGVSPDNAVRVGMVWQDPYASLDPRWSIRQSINEPFNLSKRKGDVNEVLREVGLDESHGDRLPQELSGGQRQRAAIGRALAMRPPLVVCDEPTAALDLSIRAQILNLLKDVQAQKSCSYLYISHDLSTVRFLADRVAVMYLGRIVEEGRTEDIFASPKHPYTKALLDSAPDLSKLRSLPAEVFGEIPDPRHLPPGCRYAGRCPYASDKCREADPGISRAGDRSYYCYHPLNQSEGTEEGGVR